MSQQKPVTEHILAVSRSTRVEDVLEYLDQLHTAVSERKGQGVSGLTEAETMQVLREIVYTAQETIRELETKRFRQYQAQSKMPMLRVVEKIDKAG